MSQVSGTCLTPHLQFDEEDEPDMTTRRAAKHLLLTLLLLEFGLRPRRKAEAGAGPRKARKERRRRGKERRVLRVLPLVLLEDAPVAGWRFIEDIAMVMVCCGSIYMCGQW